MNAGLVERLERLEVYIERLNEWLDQHPDRSTKEARAALLDLQRDLQTGAEKEAE